MCSEGVECFTGAAGAAAAAAADDDDDDADDDDDDFDEFKPKFVIRTHSVAAH